MGKSDIWLWFATALRSLRLAVFGVVLLLSCMFCTAACGAVSVTPGSNGTGICSNKAASGVTPAFTNLGAIFITEGVNSDFSTGTNTIVLYPPAGWQFSGVLPGLSYITGSNITGISGTIASTALTVNITVAGITSSDQITITGLQVQPVTTSAPAGYIFASSVSGMAGISTGTSGTNFAALSANPALTASVSISASPAGAICPGTNVVYTPTPANGGTPTYTWALNGVDVSIGSSYSNNSLATGNTVSCRMLSSAGCLTGNPVFSNTITTTVLVAPGVISGANNVCPGNTITLTNGTSGGAWSSTNTAKATINSSGVLTGVAAGTTTVSYTVGVCAATKVVFVNEHPFAPVLTPTTAAVCNGASVAISAAGSPAPPTVISQTFNSGLAGWTVDTIGSINILAGAEWKACADSYQNEQGWYRSPDHTPFILANADTSGSSSTLSTRLTSPSFSLADYTSATLTFQHAYDYWPAGDVYVNLEISTNGGSTWTTITNFRGANVGSKMAFVAQSFSLNAWLGNSDVKIRFFYRSAFGYYWALDNVLITGTSGVVTPSWSPATWLYTDPGLTLPYVAGTTVNTVYVHPMSVVSATPITYTATATSGACAGMAQATVTANPSPGIITGALNVCVGTGSTLGNTSSGGTWESGNTAVATVDIVSGVVNGIAPGTAAITYMLGSSCSAVAVVTVNISPAAVTGNRNVCLGYTSALADATSGGTWASDNTAVATVDASSGLVSGAALGTANITYSLGAGCVATTTVTVQPLPLPVTGASSVCATQAITLGSATAGGAWSVSNVLLATIGTGTGVVTGVAGGAVTVSYILPATGCFSLKSVTVHPQAAITGPANICVGFGTTLLNAVAGGTWLSGNTAVATIDATTGMAAGLAPGNSDITYTLPTGCAAYRELSVNPVPTDITGPTSVCAGSTITLVNSVASGSWSSSNANATVDIMSGVVTGVTAGTAVISYRIGTGCYKLATITVMPLPAAITGTATVCEAGTTLLSCATTGGTWISSNTAIASVTGGTVSGVMQGTAVITYTAPITGCYSTRDVTVNPLPAPITGTVTVCQGLTTTLASASGGGTWASSNTTIANVGATSAIVTGGASGIVNIIYTLPTGCQATALVTVNMLPGPLTGASTVCTGATTLLSSTSSGGTWGMSNPSIAGVLSGTVTGVAAGTVTITYTLPTTCIATKVMTVYPSPAAITGATSVCTGLVTTLSSATPGGGWTSANPSVAGVGASNGIINGVATGTSIITYMVVTGCIATTTVSVLPLPAPITGTLNVCPGTSAALSCATSGGTWVSSNTSVITAGSSTGIITGGATSGVATISYIVSSGCYITATAIVNPTPAPISGLSSVCEGAAIALSDISPSGTWQSDNTMVATIGSTTGVVNGVSSGTAVISYILPTGCAATKIVSVNPLPDAIVGPGSICQSSTATLTTASTGGNWVSSIPSIATIGPFTGSVYGSMGGTTNISYVLPTGCVRIMPLTVTPLPLAIVGASGVCEGSNTLFSDATPGGSWLSGSPGIATVSAAGLVSGIAAGTATISYMLPLGCLATKTISVNPIPAPITGNTSLCIGVGSPLTSASPGGVWLSSNSSVAAVTSGGVVVGFLLNTATISYMLPTGCLTTTPVTVNPTPSAITGTTGICVGSAAVYTNTIAGGTWSSSAPSIASVLPASGVVSGIIPGTAIISYTLSAGCTATKAITINPVPAAVSGPSAVCAGLSITFTNATSGGVWSSGNPFTASVAGLTGVVTGLAAGTANITYTLPAGCSTYATVTVHAVPAALTGTSSICVGATSMFGSATGGGTWSSGSSAVATVDASGLVSGLSVGSSVITYTLGIGCYATRTVSVFPLPSAITGNIPSCPGVGFALSNSSSGGVWSSTTSPGVATINPATGMVTPVASGTAVITYSIPPGCKAYTVVTVNTTPDISGPSVLCAGAAVSFTHPSASGTWSSSNTIVLSMNASTGLAVGFTAGIVNVSYTLPGGCVAVQAVTVNAAPSAISGLSTVCPGMTTTYTNSASGGTWSSGNPSFATIGASSGIITGVAPGYVTIHYTLPAGCSVSKLLSVNPVPAAISGAASVCTGNTTTLTIAATGGTWSTSNAFVAAIGISSGVVTGNTAGTATISYNPAGGCVSTFVITVNSLPAGITGNTPLCNGFSNTLANATSGGTWSSSNTAVATVGSATGMVTAVGTGTATVSYSVANGCTVTVVTTVNIQPSAISGVPSVCIGYTTGLGSTPSGGTWTSSTTTVATVPSGAGLVAGVSSGTSVITYRLASGCKASVIVTVSAVPTVIDGPSMVCEGATVTLNDPFSGGGTWSSSNVAVASAGSATGVITGMATGTATIFYIIGSGCFTSKVVTVSAVPAPLTGISNACIGLTTSLSTISTGGTWVSSNTAVATVGAGLVSGISGGTVQISYVFPSGCSAVKTVTINPAPSVIAGAATVCVTAGTTFTNAISGGSWSSSDIAIASVNSSTGLVQGVAPGSADITYTLGAGCFAVKTISVNPLPAPITGSLSICRTIPAGLTSSTPMGIWSVSDPLLATISGTSGMVTGIAPGTVTVSYSIGTGCYTTATVTVNPFIAITGSPIACVGFSTNLANSIPGGTWTSASTAIATVNSVGVVTGIVPGTATISYSLPTGCVATSVTTVTALSPVTGSLAICSGLTTTLSNAAPGGTWSSSDVMVAGVTASGGVVTGAAAGTATISYTYSTGCVATAMVTVHPLSAIVGSGTVCQGQSVTFTNTISGGTWFSADATVMVNAVSGMVTGITAGTARVTYSLPTGCQTTKIITVNPLAPVAGPGSVCLGATVTLSDAVTGGTWSSSNTGTASIGVSSGIVSGLSPGTTTIQYTLSTGCSAAVTVTVNTPPDAITGVAAVCVGQSITLANSAPGGTWSSSNAAIVIIGSSSGIATGTGGGAATVSYTLPTGCFATAVVGISPLPPAIAGALQVCEGSGITLGNAIPSGTWSSSNTSVATINTTSGYLSGLVPGTSSINYTISTGCSTSSVVTVNALPLAITGVAGVCVGSSGTLSCATPGGSWSVTGSTAGISASSGIVTGLSSGTTYVTYTLPNGCYQTRVLTVYAPPATIIGPAQICAGATAVFSSATTGGVWTSSNTAIATVNSVTGVVTAHAAGAVVISYALAFGCNTSFTVTVNPLPAAVAGAASVCAGNTTALVSASPGGTWTTGMPAVATISAAGVVSGIAAGTSVVSYLLPTGCRSEVVVTVNPLPAPITGASTVCAGLSVPFVSATIGGVWTSGTTPIATVDAVSGVVNGVMPGAASISYTLPTGCVVTKNISVNFTPAPISGLSQVCAGSSVSLSNTTTGGLWTSGTPAVATVSSAGIVNGIVAGSATVSYTLPVTGCRATIAITVNPIPPPVSGVTSICPGTGITLSNAVAGGTWSSASSSVAADALSGVVTGVAAGVAPVSYTLPTGCYTLGIVVVNPLPAAIAGAAAVCEAATSLLNCATPGGYWYSSNTGIATAALSSGLVTGVTTGVTMVSYVLPTGCASTVAVTVNPIPAPIAGAASACIGTAMSLYNTSIGGTWSSANTAIATVGSSSGTVTGVSLGATSVTYTLPTGCYITSPVSVNPLPDPIMGTTAVCQGFSVLLTDATFGGTWVSSDALVASVGSNTGVVASLTGGTAQISYILPTGCRSVLTFTVNGLLPIVGSASVCTADTVLYTNGVPGGVWSTGSPSIATVSATGRLYGISAGLTVLSYLLPSGCLATRALTVHPAPVAYYVTGGGEFCSGSTGVPIGLTGSTAGFNYYLYNGATEVAAIAGTGSTLSYGTYTVSGHYTVRSVNSVTGCIRAMADTAFVNLVAVGPATVSIAATADTVCNGVAVTFSPLTYLAGTSPVYQWQVNGSVVSAATSYSYAPADGDVVSCRLTSSSVCAIPNIATATKTTAVMPLLVPGVSIMATPGDRVCAATPVTFSATPVNGGLLPVYIWKVNGIIAGAGVSYSYTPVDNDFVICSLVSHARCRTTDTVAASGILMDVIPQLVPSVTVTAAPGFEVVPGTLITFSASATNAGALPLYQWKINGAAITGATNATFVWSVFGGGEVVSCDVTSVGACGGVTSSDAGKVVFGTGVSVNVPTASISLFPNPNKGVFTLKGHLPSAASGTFTVKITNVLGQVVYGSQSCSVNGVINEHIHLDRELTNGMYSLTLTADNGMQQVFHFVTER